MIRSIGAPLNSNHSGRTPEDNKHAVSTQHHLLVSLNAIAFGGLDVSLGWTDDWQ